MITTINQSTASVNATWPIETLAIIPIILFLALILQRGLVSGMQGPRVKWIDQGIIVAAVPLVLIFVATAIARFASLLPR